MKRLLSWQADFPKIQTRNTHLPGSSWMWKYMFKISIKGKGKNIQIQAITTQLKFTFDSRSYNKKGRENQGASKVKNVLKISLLRRSMIGSKMHSKLYFKKVEASLLDLEQCLDEEI